VAIAFRPDIAVEVIEKCCYVETKGKFTRGMVVVDWFEVYPQDSKVHSIDDKAINQNPRRTVKIVSKINVQRLLDLMLESVL
jgi:inosine-uridine nucleoside N-ribohydrolase